MGFTLRHLVIVLFLIIGSIGSLCTKWQDQTSAKNIDGDTAGFEHPYVQSLMMFIGEMSCLLFFVYFNSQLRRQAKEPEQATDDFNVLLLAIPGVLDCFGSTMMYVGLTWTAVSVYQMLRGAILVFTAVWSSIFLGRKYYFTHWFGIFCVTCGLFIVGLSSVIRGSSSSAPHPLYGDIMVVAAQIIASSQMTFEEKVLKKYKVPALMTVGWEGIFGFIAICFFLVIFYFVPGDAVGGRLENPFDAAVQIGNSGVLILTTIGNVVYIAAYNYLGVTITKDMSATVRTLLDTCRTVLVWVASLAIGWEEFYYLQPIGFVVQVFGTLIFQEIIVIPFFPAIPKTEAPTPIDEAKKPLMDNKPAQQQQPTSVENSLSSQNSISVNVANAVDVHNERNINTHKTAN
eukprot:TRINITY_DN1623_c0_g1_i1.p1 TRINITY_DN1623_c0_g1~~TRINITY_DN1623_c0_g1_i1.p1  ORF type:complete len:415 (+),score=84.06 TRINITY_DN1623_c0_g1_i1:44-1246(+)